MELPNFNTATGETVSIQTKREYIILVWIIYQEALKRAERIAILDELVRNLKIHRNAAIRLMNSKREPKLQRGSGNRKRKYLEATVQQLIKLWKAMGYMGTEKFIAALPDWLPSWSDEGCTLEVRDQLLSISESQAERYLAPERAKYRRLQNTGTKRSYNLKTSIPLSIDSDLAGEPGHLQVDSVALCGDSMSGQFIWTVTATDALTGWTHSFAVWHKNSEQIVKGLLEIEAQLPFAVKSWSFDNGTEFINEHVISTFKEKRHIDARVELYRSRPYKKNDQCRVEQKNNEHIRKLIGYPRLDCKETLPILDKLLQTLWNPLCNLYVPQVKLVTKKRVGSKVKKTYDKSQTPYERFINLPNQNTDERSRMAQLYESINPFVFRQKVNEARKKIIARQGASDNWKRRFAS